MQIDKEGILHHEILGITITKELHYNSKGFLRWCWVLRDAEGNPCYMTRTKEDLIHEMMFDTIKHNEMKLRLGE